MTVASSSERSILGQIRPMAVSDFHYLHRNIVFISLSTMFSHMLTILSSSSTVWLLGRRLCRLPEESEWTHPPICWPFEMLDAFQLFIHSCHWGSCMNNKLAESAQWHTLKLYIYVCIFKNTHKKVLGYCRSCCVRLYKGSLRCRAVGNQTLLVPNLLEHEW